jgi:hypothetical protein
VKNWKIHASWAGVTLLTAAAWGSYTARRASPPAQPAAATTPAPRPLRGPQIPELPTRPEPRADKSESPAPASTGIEEIRRLIQSSSPEDRRQAFTAIWNLTDRPLKLELLKLALKFDDDITVHRLILGLGEHGGPEAGVVLIQILKSAPKDWMKENAAGWLGNTGGPGAVEALLEAYQSGKFYLQVKAAGSLYKQGIPGPLSEMLPKVGEMMSNPDGAVRRDAVEELGHLAFPEALPLLTRALQDSNGDVRIQALRALGTGKIPSAIQLVEKMLADPNADVVHEAERTLRELRK